MLTKRFIALFMMCLFIGCGDKGDKDHFTDSRDGQKYRTVKMPDGKTWMARNLNFETASGSWCYDDDVANCEIYGRLYDWNTAMTACPQGWRLPTDEDWQALINSVGGDSVAGTKLKSETGWSTVDSCWSTYCGDYILGTDDFGFSALPGGLRYGARQFYFSTVGIYGSWWTAKEYDATRALIQHMSYNREPSYSNLQNKTYGYSVRCIRE